MVKKATWVVFSVAGQGYRSSVRGRESCLQNIKLVQLSNPLREAANVDL